MQRVHLCQLLPQLPEPRCSCRRRQACVHELPQHPAHMAPRAASAFATGPGVAQVADSGQKGCSGITHLIKAVSRAQGLEMHTTAAWETG